MGDGFCSMLASAHEDERCSEGRESGKRADSGREVSGERKGSKCGHARTTKSSMAAAGEGGGRRCVWQVAGEVSKCGLRSK